MRPPLDSAPRPPKYACVSLPPAYLRQKLTQPLPTKDGAVLRTIGEAANYVLALPPERAEHCNRWRHSARLLLDQAENAPFTIKFKHSTNRPHGRWEALNPASQNGYDPNRNSHYVIMVAADISRRARPSLNPIVVRIDPRVERLTE